MSGTAVPEASVNENDDPLLVEYEIRFPEERLIATPAGDVLAAQELHQCDFRVLVAAPANPRHYFRPLPP